MKRCYFGAVLLAALLAAALGATCVVDRCQSPVAEALTSGAEAFQNREPDAGKSRVMDARLRWVRCRSVTAALVDHGPMEAVDAAFAQLEVYIRTGDWDTAAALCADLSSQVEAIVDSHRPNWWNLL